MEAIFALFSMFFMLLWGLFFVFFLGGFALWVWMLVDAISREDKRYPNADSNTKIMWILILMLTGLIGGVVYYFMMKRKIP